MILLFKIRVNYLQGYFKTIFLIYNLEPAEKPDYGLLKKLLKQYITESLGYVQ